MSIIIDISAYQSSIDFEKIATQDIDRIIIRTTTQNGSIDARFMENLNGALKYTKCTIDGYKFAYTRDYVSAYVEATRTLDTLAEHGALRWLDTFWLDLEGFGGRDYTKDEANAVIKGYRDAVRDSGDGVKFGLYFNYNYAKNIVDTVWKSLPLWVARYNKTLGDVSPWSPVMWQYTSTGTVDGINGNVDISKYCEATNE